MYAKAAAMDITTTRKNTVIFTLIFLRKENFDRKEVFIRSPPKTIV